MSHRDPPCTAGQATALRWMDSRLPWTHTLNCTWSPAPLESELPAGTGGTQRSAQRAQRPTSCCEGTGTCAMNFCCPSSPPLSGPPSSSDCKREQPEAVWRRCHDRPGLQLFNRRDSPGDALSSETRPGLSAKHKGQQNLTASCPRRRGSRGASGLSGTGLRAGLRRRSWVRPSCVSRVVSLANILSWRPRRLKPSRLLCPWDSPGQNTGMGGHFLLQGKLS